MSPDRTSLFELLKLHYERGQKLLDLLIKIHGFYLVMTGAILSFYLTKRETIPYMEYSIFFLELIGILCLIFCMVEKRQFKKTINSIDNIMSVIGTKNYPNFEIVSRFLIASVILYTSMCIGLGLVYYFTTH